MLDQCDGDLMNANHAHKAYVEHYTNPGRQIEKTVQNCVRCLSAAKELPHAACGRPTVAVRTSCECQGHDPDQCKCTTNMSIIAILIIAVLLPMLSFANICCCLFLCVTKLRGQHHEMSTFTHYPPSYPVSSTRSMPAESQEWSANWKVRQRVPRSARNYGRKY